MQAWRSASHSGQVVRRPTGPSNRRVAPHAVAGRRHGGIIAAGGTGGDARAHPVRPVPARSSASRSAGWPRCSRRCARGDPAGRLYAVKRILPTLAEDGELRPDVPRRGAARRPARPPGHRPGPRARAAGRGATTSPWTTCRARPARARSATRGAAGRAGAGRRSPRTSAAASPTPSTTPTAGATRGGAAAARRPPRRLARRTCSSGSTARVRRHRLRHRPGRLPGPPRARRCCAASSAT